MITGTEVVIKEEAGHMMIREPIIIDNRTFKITNRRVIHYTPINPGELFFGFYSVKKEGDYFILIPIQASHDQ